MHRSSRDYRFANVFLTRRDINDTCLTRINRDHFPTLCNGKRSHNMLARVIARSVDSLS